MERKAALIIGANGEIGKELEKKLGGYYTLGTRRRKSSKELTTKDFTDGDSTIWTRELIDDADSICLKLKEHLKEKEACLKIIFYVAGFGRKEEEVTEDISKEMYDVNAYAAEKFAQNFPEVKFVYFSSCAVLGTTGTKDLETYAETKREAEKLLKKQKLKDLVVVRPSIILGTGFAKEAHLEFPSKGFPNAEETVDYLIDHLNKKLIVPGAKAKLLHIFHKVSPKLAQRFLKVESKIDSKIS